MEKQTIFLGGFVLGAIFAYSGFLTFSAGAVTGYLITKNWFRGEMLTLFNEINRT